MAGPTYRLEPREEVAEWLVDGCHPQADVRERVSRKFNHAFRLISRYGPVVGRPHLRKLRRYPGLYEVRVEDTTGWYRIFCGFGQPQPGSPTVVALSSAGMKHEQSFTDHEYRVAAMAVREHLAELNEHE